MQENLKVWKTGVLVVVCGLTMIGMISSYQFVIELTSRPLPKEIVKALAIPNARAIVQSTLPPITGTTEHVSVKTLIALKERVHGQPIAYIVPQANDIVIVYGLVDGDTAYYAKEIIEDPFPFGVKPAGRFDGSNIILMPERSNAFVVFIFVVAVWFALFLFSLLGIRHLWKKPRPLFDVVAPSPNSNRPGGSDGGGRGGRGPYSPH